MYKTMALNLILELNAIQGSSFNENYLNTNIEPPLAGISAKIRTAAEC